jgi:Tol biopolymer transport system component
MSRLSAFRVGYALSLASAAVLLAATAETGDARVLQRVSVAADGAQANGHSYYPAISPDGRYVAFESSAANLVAGDTNAKDDVFLYDRQTGAVIRVSVATDGAQSNGNSYSPSVSADGLFVAFESSAANLVANDTNAASDVFVYERQTGFTTRVSIASDGAQANGYSYSPSISADGRYVAFRSDATNLVPDDTNGSYDIFVHDRRTGLTTRVSMAGDGTQANGHSYSPAVSADGRFVAFKSEATNLVPMVPGDSNGVADIFVHDRSSGLTTRASVAGDGTQANGPSSEPAISADGRYVAFESSAANLVAGDTNGKDDVFVHDRRTGATTRVSIGSDGAQGDDASLGAAISGDGRYVAFHSAAKNLVPFDTNARTDIFVHDRETGLTSRVSVSGAGVQADDYSRAPSITDDGRYLVFHSLASNLVAGDTNRLYDIFSAVNSLWIYCGFSCSPASPIAGEPVLFEASCSFADASSYQWLFGYAETAQGEAVSHTFATTGSYQICLTVAFPDSYVITTCQTLEVGEPAASVCATTDTQICLPTAGWHLIGQPRSGDHPLATCQVRDNATGQTVWFCEAAAAPYTWVDTLLYRWDPVSMGYLRCDCLAEVEGDLLWCYGYWLYTYIDDLTLIVP